METIEAMIRPELLVLAPVLYFLGAGLRRAAVLPERFVPLALGVAGVALALLYLAATLPAATGREFALVVFAAVTQGVLCAGCSILAGRLFRRSGKNEEEP